MYSSKVTLSLSSKSICFMKASTSWSDAVRFSCQHAGSAGSVAASRACLLRTALSSSPDKASFLSVSNSLKSCNHPISRVTRSRGILGSRFCKSPSAQRSHRPLSSAACCWRIAWLVCYRSLRCYLCGVFTPLTTIPDHIPAQSISICGWNCCERSAENSAGQNSVLIAAFCQRYV